MSILVYATVKNYMLVTKVEILGKKIEIWWGRNSSIGSSTPDVFQQSSILQNSQYRKILQLTTFVTELQNETSVIVLGN
jgi:hypothetical protein